MKGIELSFYYLESSVVRNSERSSLRDTIGIIGDLAFDPRTYVFNRPIFYVVRPYELVNDTSLRIGEYEDVKEAAIDPYSALKDAYHQYRQNKIRQR